MKFAIFLWKAMFIGVTTLIAVFVCGAFCGLVDSVVRAYS